MEDVIDSDVKRERLGPYGHPPPPANHRMPPTETPVSHSYPAPPGPAIQHPWQPTPSPYEPGEHRPPPPDQPPHTPYPAQHYPLHGRESYPPAGYPPEASFSRPGSISGPSRSPAEVPHPHFQSVNGTINDARYYSSQPPPPEYRYSIPHAPPESPANGSQPPPPPGLQVATAPHEMMAGHPPPGQPPYGPPSAGPPPYPPQYFGGDPSYPRRKPVRAAQACDSCRQRKAKCDEGRPECSYCKENSLKCTYREIPPQKQEKHVLALNEKLEAMAQGQDDMRKLLSIQDDKINHLMEMMQNSFEHTPKGTSSSSTNNPPHPVPTARLKRETSQPAATSQANLNHSFSSYPAQSPKNSDSNLPASDELALPAEHYTAAQNLLEWDSIRALFPPGKVLTKSYVMDRESNRGLLRLYGCGEGRDDNDGGQGAPSPAGSSASSRMDDVSSMSSPDEVWGSGQIPPPSPSLRPTGFDHPGGVSPRGGLNLDATVLDRCHKSYMENMHILHPFLHSKVLREMVHLFKRRYSPGYAWQHKLAGNLGKRKREQYDSGSPSSGYDPMMSHGSHRPQGRVESLPSIEHSITNAIVLLVVALGKICAHKESPLPAAPTPAPQISTPGNSFTDVPVPSGAAVSSAPPSPYNQTSYPRSSGKGDFASTTAKNMDQIPGLAYFARAADILGEHAGGNDVSHVQANLLAGLYMGQLARVLPSHYYISAACRACMVLVDSTDYKSNDPKRMPRSRRDLINFAFWSCLQLESDILAEVELPPSGISRYEGRMMTEMPRGPEPDPECKETGGDVEVVKLYLDQIQLRRTLNDIHRDLYKQQYGTQRAQVVFSIMKACNESLEGWRSKQDIWGLNWDDNDHKSDNINIARVRGKYYGAKYIIHRPALYFALLQTQSSSTPRDRPSESPVGANHGSQLTSPATQHSSVRAGRTGGNMGPPSKYGEELDKQVLAAAKACVDAAIRSTTSFDGVPGRLIVTNIFGTAHA